MSTDPTQIWLTRGKAKDLVTCGLPSLPDRLHLADARRFALGWREGDETASEPVDTNDMLAVQWAALGLCARSGLVGVTLPKLRDHRRDVVAFGEAVASVVWDAGYRDLREVLDAGANLITWVDTQTWGEAEAVAAEAEGFPKAPEPATGPGAL